MSETSPLSMADLAPKVPSQFEWSGRCNLKGLIRLRQTRFSEAEQVSRLQRALDKAGQRIAVDLKQALDDAMRSDVWSGPQGLSDIHESGELMRSGTVRVDRDGIHVSYDEPYAALVHYGGYIHPYGNTEISVYLPPRPWVEAVLRGGGPVPKFDIEKYYRDEIEKAFSR